MARGVHADSEEPLKPPLGPGAVPTSTRASRSGRPFVTRSWRALTLLAFLLCFLVGIRALGTGFELLGKDVAESFFRATSNPLVGLCIGILATSLVQSSSVTTSMVVALVAAPENPLPVAHAVPMVMGANIGTTVTNTIVSMGHVANPKEFQRAIAAGTCDDFFNLGAVLLLLPLELATGVLRHTAGLMAQLIPRTQGASLPNPISATTALALEPLEDFCSWLMPSAQLAGVLMLVLAALLIALALYNMVGALRRLTGSRVQDSLGRALDKSALVGIGAGAVLTALIQSSSLTLSVLVPFAATGIITLEQMFPLALGANLGTTVTALIAATAVARETFPLAIQIALVHLLFNTAGILLIYPIRRVRQVPLGLSRWIGKMAVRSKTQAALCVIGLFYGLPVAALLASTLLTGD